MVVVGQQQQHQETVATGPKDPPRLKAPNIYVKKPHRKQPALGLFLAKADPEDKEDWRLKSGECLEFSNLLIQSTMFNVHY